MMSNWICPDNHRTFSLVWDTKESSEETVEKDFQGILHLEKLDTRCQTCGSTSLRPVHLQTTFPSKESCLESLRESLNLLWDGVYYGTSKEEDEEGT